MAKKVKKTGLTREDLWKYVPKKSKTGLLPVLCSVLFEHGKTRASNLETMICVPSDTEVNFPIAVSVSTLTPLVKSKDWPKSIRAYVELIDGKKKLKAEITTEKGHVFWVRDYELYDAEDFPQEVAVDFLPKGEITEYDAKIISTCADFCELARTQNVNESIWDIDVEKGQMRGFDVNMGAAFPTALEECRISVGVARYCLEGGSIFYGAIKTGQHFVRVGYGDGSWIAGRVGDRVYPQVENLFEDDLKLWFEVTAKAHEWRRCIALMMNYWQKGQSVRVSSDGNGKRVLMGLYEFAPNQKRECLDVEACPRVEMDCRHYSHGPNSMGFNPKLLKVQLDQFDDLTNVTLQFYGVHGYLDKMGEIVHRHKPLRIFNDSMLGRRLLMPVVDWSQRIHTGEEVS